MKHKYFAILFLLMISVLTACSGGSESTKTSSQDIKSGFKEAIFSKLGWAREPTEVYPSIFSLTFSLINLGLPSSAIPIGLMPILQSVRAPSQVLKKLLL